MSLLLSVNEGCRHPVKRIAAAVISTPVLGLSTASAAGEKSFFRSPPTDVAIHNPASTENPRNRTTISVRVPDNAGNALQQVVLSQISAEDPWDWGRQQPELYLGDFRLRKKGNDGIAEARVSNRGRELTVLLEPPVQPVCP